MKTYLKANDGSFHQLAPKVTTVGKEGCDIILQTAGVDSQHAVIEYSELEDCYVLQDLNSLQGTYVNDVRVQNAAVRLAPGDIIRFGFSGTAYEMVTETPPPTQLGYPPVQQRPTMSQPLTVINDMGSLSYSQAQINAATGLPYITTPTLTIPSAVWFPNQTGPALPRPPLRSRPLSAGSARRATSFDRLQTVTGQPVGSPMGASQPLLQRTSGGWVNTMNGRPVSSASPGPPPPQHADLSLIQEKEQKILQLQEEVGRLRATEMESFRKEQQLQLLQQQNSELQSRLSQQQPPVVMGGDADMTARLVHLENEVTAKQEEIAELRQQLSHLQSEAHSDIDNPANLRRELADKVKELNNLRNELERVKKDKSITAGLVSQMQRDMSSKDSSISKLSREIEALKKEIRERDVQISSLTAKMSKSKETPRSDAIDAREKELVSLRQKFKTAENKIQEQHDLIASLREELDKTKQTIFDEKDVQRKLKQDLEQAKSACQDMERAERVVRVDMEQASKKAERFRNRVFQVTFSTPGIKAPDTEISDDELLETLKKVVDERTDSLRKIKDLQDQLKLSESSSKDFKKTIGGLRRSVENVVALLKTKGRLSGALKEQISLIQSVTTEESLVWVRDAIVNLLNGELAWEQNTESALESCGVNVKLTNDEPSKHISLLFAKWESAIAEKDRLTKQLSDMEQKFKADLHSEIELQKQDAQTQIADAVEKARLEVEQKLNRAIDDIRAVETEKRETAVEAEKRKIEELEMTIQELRIKITEKQESDQEKLEAASGLVLELEQYKLAETQLREELQKLEALKAEEIQKLEEQISEKDKKCETDVSSYKEQIKQHSVTICAMEERLTKIMKKNKEYQEEIETHKKAVQELRVELKKRENIKPAPPPKPKVIVQKPTQDIIAMEQLIVVLRNENADLKKCVQEQEDVILGLRRDLTGAHARLSDITGELSESQKQEMEKYKDLMNQREKEVIEARQQLAKLSRIIDKQKEEMKTLETELSKEKSISVKFRSTMDEKSQAIRSLEQQLLMEKDEQNKQLELLDQEGRITSELTALGAQCRGERHQQVIDRQREALSELRGRIKTLECSKPPLPNQDQALQQVILLKKELAEMRATQALNEDKNIQSITALDREVGRARGLSAQTNAEADMERSAHRETMEALESSESCFLNLIGAVSSHLEMEDIEGNRPIGHLPKDERERLVLQREKACELLTNRIRVLKERIARKDELLTGYERDLAKMRQAQELAERKGKQVESLANDVRSRTEESHYLRESLNRTRDRLDQEKRLNTAIKQRKTFHLENERVHMAPASHRCKPEDPKASIKKRKEKEIMKRKNYEIKTLKTDLTAREKDLFESNNRLYTLEHSLDLGSQAEIIES